MCVWFRHDYLGRSTARGAFMVWTHHMKNITYYEIFKPTGAPSDVALQDSEPLSYIDSL